MFYWDTPPAWGGGGLSPRTSHRECFGLALYLVPRKYVQEDKGGIILGLLNKYFSNIIVISKHVNYKMQ